MQTPPPPSKRLQRSTPRVSSTRPRPPSSRTAARPLAPQRCAPPRPWTAPHFTVSGARGGSPCSSIGAHVGLMNYACACVPTLESVLCVCVRASRRLRLPWTRGHRRHVPGRVFRDRARASRNDDWQSTASVLHDGPRVSSPSRGDGYCFYVCVRDKHTYASIESVVQMIHR